MRRHHQILSGSIVTIALLASGCGSSSSDASGTDGGGESFEDLELESPLSEFLGQSTGFSFSEDDEAEMIAQQQEVEEAAALCMRELGWEYIPQDASQFISFGSDEEIPYGSPEWTEKYGFGVTTQRFSQSTVGPDLVGYEDSFMGEDEGFVDPNQDYVEALSQDEQDAYYEALYGTEPDLPENATDEELNEAYENWTPDGCQNQAQEDVSDQMAFYNDFGDELDELYTRMETDPRATAFREEVAACVADKGYTWPTDGSGPYELFEDRLAEIGPDYETDPFAESGLDPETMTSEEIDAFYRDYEKLDDADLAALAELQAEELELATIVTECGGGMVAEAKAMNEIMVELEQEFLDANADRLAPYEGAAG